MHPQGRLPVFLFHDFLDICVRAHCIVLSLSAANLNDFLGLDGLVAGAALRVEKLQQFLQGFGVGRVAQERALPPHAHQVFVLELVEMVG